MLTRYIVSYDICDDKRLRTVYRIMRGFGDHLQYSVFRCDLSKQKLTTMIHELDAVIDHRADQILIIDLGPCTGRASKCFRALGRPYVEPERTVIVV